MPEFIELKRPVMIDGHKVKRLSYDVDAVTTDQFIEADLRSAGDAARLASVAVKVPEVDTTFQLYLGIMAVIAANPGYTVEDVKRVAGVDSKKLVDVGRNFMTPGSEEDEGEVSDEDGDIFLEEAE